MSCCGMVEKANQKFYDLTAARYSGMIQSRKDPAYTDFVDCVDAFVPRGARLLDVGTGTGKILDLVETRYKTVGIDVSHNMLRVACSTRVVQASCFQLPFEDCTFGGVTAYSVLHHLYSVEPLFREIYRVLQPGSWLITDNDSNASFHSWFGWWIRFRRFFKQDKMNLADTEKSLYTLSEYHHSTGLNARTIESSLRKEGFVNVSVKFCHPPVPDWFTRILMRLELIIPKEICRYYLRVCAKKP